MSSTVTLTLTAAPVPVTASIIATRLVSDNNASVTNVLEQEYKVAMDKSGSMNGARWNNSTKLIRNLLDQENPEVIAWCDIAKVFRLNEIKPYGCTDPCVFMPYMGTATTAVVTTDGEFDKPSMMVPLIRDSKLANVIAIYIGERDKRPSELNLSVFAPFQSIGGVFVLCHYNGTDLRVLLHQGVKNGELPSTPEEVTVATEWHHFPEIDPVALRILTGPNHVERLGQDEFMLSDQRTVVDVMATLKNAGRADNDGFEEFDQFIRDEIFNLISATKQNVRLESVRHLVNLWHKRALDHARNRVVNTGLYDALRSEADELLRKIKLCPDDVDNRKKFGVVTARLFELGSQIEEVRASYVRPVERLHSAIMLELNACASSKVDYSLAGLARANRPSNRAQRAKVVSGDKLDSDSIRVDGAYHAECDICAEYRPMSILMQSIPQSQSLANTNDFALNDPLSLGAVPDNQCAFSGSPICVFCADYLIKAGKTNPFTRQDIAGMLPVVSLSHRHNLAVVSAEVSRVFFGGKKLSLEMQFVLGMLFALEPSGRFPSEMVNFLYREILFNTRSNFTTVNGNGLPMIDAITQQVLAADVDPHRPITMLEPIRNRSVFTLVVMMCMALRFKPQDKPLDNYQSILIRLLAKIVTGRILDLAKKNKEAFMHFRAVLDTELYDCSTGMPIRGSQRLVTLNSRALQMLFDDGWFQRNVLAPIGRYTAQTNTTVESILTPEFVTVLLYEVSANLDVNTSEEACVSLLVQQRAAYRSFFTSRDTISRETLLEELQQRYAKVPVADLQHGQIPQFSTIDLRGPPVTFCSLCGTSFVDGNNMVSLANKRDEHFKEVFHTAVGCVPTKTSSNISLHKTVFNVATRYPELLRPTRLLVLEVLAALRKDGRGNLYEAGRLTDVVICLWDFLQKRQIYTPDFEFQRISDRAQAEIAHGLKAGIYVATTDGLTDEEISTLTAPLSSTINEELRKFRT